MTLTYDEAQAMMSKARNGRRKLENNTWLEERTFPVEFTDSKVVGHCAKRLRPEYAVRLHDTDVVTLHPDGSYTLDSGGWRTVTTKARINHYAPGSVGSDRGQWFYYPHGWSGTRYCFADGMRVIPHGDSDGIGDGRGFTVEGAGADETKIRRDLLREIRAYVDGFAANAVANGLADPGLGDCWGCLFVPVQSNGAKPGKPAPWGQDAVTKPGADQPMGLGHIFEHFRERYYVPSLLWRAVQRYGNPAVCYQLIQADVCHGRTTMLKDDLRAYFKKLMPALVEYRKGEVTK